MTQVLKKKIPIIYYKNSTNVIKITNRNSLTKQALTGQNKLKRRKMKLLSRKIFIWATYASVQ